MSSSSIFFSLPPSISPSFLDLLYTNHWGDKHEDKSQSLALLTENGTDRLMDSYNT